MRALIGVVVLALASAAVRPEPDRAPRAGGALERALELARTALDDGRLELAQSACLEALEHDPACLPAWDLYARWAQAAEQRDARLWALHRARRLARAQGEERAALEAREAQLVAEDPVGAELLDLEERFRERLHELGERYEEKGRPHGAIAVHRRMLALDPEDTTSLAAIARMAAVPDPSLAAAASAPDLLAGLSREFLDEHDAAHATWPERAVLERDNYVTHTDAGYVVMVRASEAMEQMSAFYKRFFRYGTPEDGNSVPRIDLRIFANKDEYLELGSGPPVEWSAGQFTGSAVELYVGEGGFEGMLGTLFHEAAHQYVSLATPTSGWLNEGLASFFEGARLLANGSVVMNLPAEHRLFPLLTRMGVGWMSGPTDGVDPGQPSREPRKAPRFRTVVEGDYAWGPAWYAPTWGVVYFLYNVQGEEDGRFLYREALWEFVRASRGLRGAEAVARFEEVVLGNPKPPYAGGEADDLPRSIDALDAWWQAWLTEVKDRLEGRSEQEGDVLTWARAARAAGDVEVALEHLERGVVERPRDVELGLELADLLAEELENEDRAARLVEAALALLGAQPDADPRRLDELERRLTRLDRDRARLQRIEEELLASALAAVRRYAAAGLERSALDVAWRLGSGLESSALLAEYGSLLEAGARPLRIWRRVYDEEGLAGWSLRADQIFQAAGRMIEARFEGEGREEFAYRFLTLDAGSGGDYSFESEVFVAPGGARFSGLVFGRKDKQSFHGVVLFPPDATGGRGWLDLMSSYGGGQTRTWRHVPVPSRAARGGSSAGEWRKLRLDVVGAQVDVWVDDELVLTHAFPSSGVVRGGFGLLAGPGHSRFQQMRVLDLDPRDPAAQVERARWEASLAASGASAVEGSWQGRVPPPPEVARWVRGELGAFGRPGWSPRLLVLTSIAQNRVMPLASWLGFVEKRWEDVGLELVSVFQADDDEALDAWLSASGWPGSVAVDSGATFEAHWIERYQLPRLVLLDVDGRVAWEGDPGFALNQAWEPGQSSYLDDPLRSVVEGARLEEFAALERAWPELREQLLRGQLEQALPLWEAALELPDPGNAALRQARAARAALEGALDEPAATALALESAGLAPCARDLIAWAELLGRPLDAEQVDVLEDLAREPAGRAWTRALRELDRFANKREPDAEDARELVLEVRAYEGRVPALLADELEARLAAEGVAGVLVATGSGAQTSARALARWLWGD